MKFKLNLEESCLVALLKLFRLSVTLRGIMTLIA